MDAPSLSVSLPLEKRQRYLTLVAGLMDRRHVTKLELLQVAGCLIHCAQVFPQGKPFLRLIFSKAHSVKELHFRVNLNKATRIDLRWWHDVLSE